LACYFYCYFITNLSIIIIFYLWCSYSSCYFIDDFLNMWCSCYCEALWSAEVVLMCYINKLWIELNWNWSTCGTWRTWRTLFLIKSLSTWCRINMCTSKVGELSAAAATGLFFNSYSFVPSWRQDQSGPNGHWHKYFLNFSLANENPSLHLGSYSWIMFSIRTSQSLYI